jgi:hypothetical protein
VPTPVIFSWPVSVDGTEGLVALTADDTALGVDIACMTDVDMALSLAAGVRNLGFALARRLITPRGGLFYDPDYGLDVRDYLGAGLSDAELQALTGAVQLELEKDERVESCSVAAVFNVANNRLSLTCAVTTEDAVAFGLVLSISSLTVELLQIQAV